MITLLALSANPATGQAAPGADVPPDRLVQGARLLREGRLSEGIRVLDALARSGEADPRRLARARMLVGRADQDLGQYSDAERAYQQALAVLRAKPDAGTDLSAALDDLGALYRDMGRFKEARSLREQALAGYSAAADRRGMALVNNNLAEIALDQESNREARKYVQQAFAAMEDGAALDGDDRAALYSTAGRLAIGTHDGSSALANYRIALRWWTKMHGEDHYLTGRGYMLVGRSLAQMGSHQEAIENFERGLAILKRTIGEKSILYTSGEFAYAEALSRVGKSREAAQIRQSAQAMRTEMQSARCPNCMVDASALR